MERDMTEQAPVHDWGAVPDDELARWLETVRVVGMSGIRCSADAAAILAEAARRLRGRDDGTVA